MSQDLITIEVDGKSLKAKKGEMLIRVTDAAGITVPRFCYHKKLSVAANCRMCLVEVEKAPKPMPACATPVMDGMKVHTKSARALDAQKGVMEFLLINHPLDCPICDQGGECELQDVAMGYGGDVSRYTEAKRVVKDKDIGPLVSTDMTRCIHCTRCVRFGEEIAGLRELGATGRGENMRIGTYVEKAMTSELSGNIIDLCPVGALNAKPSRFSGRSWEMVQHSTVAPHDCIGSNLYMHTLRGQIKRVVPKENEEINETWLSDRDRFSYEGILSADRLTSPMIKQKGQWKKVAWEDALDAVKKGIAEQIKVNGADALGTLVSPTATLEELFLLQQLTRGLGSHNIDHRLRQQNFSDQEHAPVMPWLGSDITALENVDAALFVASNIRKEQPMAAHRIRKAAMKGAQISFVNSRAYDFHFPVAAQQIASAYELHNELAAIASVLYKAKKEKPSTAIANLLDGVEVTAAHQQIAQNLSNAKRGVVILGSQACISPQFSALRLLSHAIAKLSGCSFGYLPEAGNSAGAWLTACVPHRGVAGAVNKKAGLNTAQMLEKALPAYLLFNVEPEFDCINPELAIDTLQQSSFVVACTPYITDAMKSYAHVLLPIATFAETSGTYVNAEGQWQTVKAVAQAAGETRPGWKVLRVLGNLFGLDNFEQLSSDDVRLTVQAQCQNIQLDNNIKEDYAVKPVPVPRGLLRLSEVALYSGDSVLRRAKSLQNTIDAKSANKTYISDATAKKQKLSGVTRVNVVQGEKNIVMDLVIDNGIPANCVWVASGTVSSEQLGAAFGAVKLEAI